MSAEPSCYLDSSAIVKLVVREPESDALRRRLAAHSSLVSCALARVEVPRAVHRHGAVAAQRARAALAGLALVRLDNPLLDAAATLELPGLRSLDAIHLASALALGEDLAELITYDRRMLAAARALELTAGAPA